MQSAFNLLFISFFNFAPYPLNIMKMHTCTVSCYCMSFSSCRFVAISCHKTLRWGFVPHHFFLAKSKSFLHLFMYKLRPTKFKNFNFTTHVNEILLELTFKFFFKNESDIPRFCWKEHIHTQLNSYTCLYTVA